MNDHHPPKKASASTPAINGKGYISRDVVIIPLEKWKKIQARLELLEKIEHLLNQGDAK